MSLSTGSTSERPQTAELVALAAESDPAVTERTLEFWRHEGLLPRPQRDGQSGKTPVWTYPPEATSQLRVLLRLRGHTKDLNVLRAALWFEGYPVDTAKVRMSISAYLRQLRDVFERELQKRSSGAEGPEAREQAIRSVAQVLARKRGQAFPRLSRQALSERTDAIALMLTLILGDELRAPDLEAHGHAVERLIGVDRGRRYRPAGVVPWLDGPPEEGLQAFAAVGSLPRLVAVVDSASELDLQAARTLAATLLSGIAAFSRIADAIVGRDNASGMLGMALLQNGDPQAVLFVVALVLSILRSSELAANLSQVVDALEGNVLPLEKRLRALAALSSAEQAARLKHLEQLPFADQVSVKRLLVDFRRDTPLTT